MSFYCLPVAKIRGRAALDRRMRELMLDGVGSIMEGSNPKMIRNKLSAYIVGGERGSPAKDSTRQAALSG